MGNRPTPFHQEVDADSVRATMTAQANGQTRRWDEGDAAMFEDDERVCAECGLEFQEGQMVQERPAFSLRFYHVDPEDCEA